jgi:NAD(P)H dehydrogenase (quinone)
VATPEELEQYDAIIIGTPTRYGNACGQIQAYLDSTGALWARGALIGKAAGAFVSTATQHGGQETTLRALHTALLHHGMVIVGLPYAWQGQMGHAEVTGGTPYGASTVAGGQGERQPSENELEGARHQGKYTAEIASKLAAH